MKPTVSVPFIFFLFLVVFFTGWLIGYNSDSEEPDTKEAEFTRKLDSLATKYDSIEAEAGKTYEALERLKTRDSMQAKENHIQKLKIKVYEKRLKDIDTLRIADPSALFEQLYPSPGLSSGNPEVESRTDSARFDPQAGLRLSEPSQRQPYSGAGINQSDTSRLHKGSGGDNPEPGSAITIDARTNKPAEPAMFHVEKRGHQTEAVKMGVDRRRGSGQRIFTN